MNTRWQSFIVRLVFAALVASFLATVPLPRLPSGTWFAYIQVPIVVFLFICYVGKLLIDTFYYDRYKP